MFGVCDATARYQNLYKPEKQKQHGIVDFQMTGRKKWENKDNTHFVFLCILLWPVPWLVLFFETFFLSRVLCSCFDKLKSRFSF